MRISVLCTAMLLVLLGCKAHEELPPINLKEVFGIDNVYGIPRNSKSANEKLVPGEFRIAFQVTENYPATILMRKISDKLKEKGFSLYKGKDSMASGVWGNYIDSRIGKNICIDSVMYEFRNGELPESYMLAIQYQTDCSSKELDKDRKLAQCYIFHDLRRVSSAVRNLK